MCQDRNVLWAFLELEFRECTEFLVGDKQTQKQILQEMKHFVLQQCPLIDDENVLTRIKRRYWVIFDQYVKAKEEDGATCEQIEYVENRVDHLIRETVKRRKGVEMS